MTPRRVKATVVDAPGYEACAALGDLCLAVRTPRSRDFVTVEVGPLESAPHPPPAGGAVVPESAPSPHLTAPWRGEVHIGRRGAVRFRLGRQTYRLTLERLNEAAWGFPWVECEFELERR
jgi:hypothetical protein